MSQLSPSTPSGVGSLAALKLTFRATKWVLHLPAKIKQDVAGVAKNHYDAKLFCPDCKNTRRA